jgi:hypothetical protein
MSTSDSNQPTSQTQGQPSASAGAPATAAMSVAPAAAPVGSPATPASTTSATPAATPGETKQPVGETKPATAETPPVETKPPEAIKPAEAPVAVPESYTITAPQGVELDKGFVTAMTPAFKDAGLTQAQVDKLANSFIGFQSGLAKVSMARDLEVTLKDADLGGMRWGQTQGFVNDALGAFTTPEFRSKLEKWGIANDLEFVRVFAAVGKAMRGDTPTPRNPSTMGDEPLADRIYRKARKAGNE